MIMKKANDNDFFSNSRIQDTDHVITSDHPRKKHHPGYYMYVKAIAGRVCSTGSTVMPGKLWIHFITTVEREPLPLETLLPWLQT